MYLLFYLNIVFSIRRCGGKIGGEDGAAELLGLNLSTLRGKMRKYGIKS
ncbi:MAG: helix-turn-helix domain-containing protein [Deferribacterales bacterium]